MNTEYLNSKACEEFSLTPHISIFDPQAYLQEDNFELFRHHVGNGGRLLHTISELYNATPDDAKNLYYTSWRQAGEFLGNYTAQTFPTMTRALEQNNMLEGASPQYVAEFLANAKDGVTHHQALLRLMVSKLILDGEQMYVKNNIPQKIQAVNAALNTMYSGRTSDARVLSLHDNLTNATLAHTVEYNEVKQKGINGSYGDTHVKGLYFPIRKINIDGEGVLVSATARVKNTSDIVFKTLAKAAQLQKYNGRIDMQHTVKDVAGFSFTSLHPEISPQDMCEYFAKVLPQQIPGTYAKMRRQTNGREGQAIEHMERFDLFFDADPKLPVEVIFTSLEERINKDYQIYKSKYSANAQAPDGQAHDLYRLKRAYSLQNIVLPPQIIATYKDELRLAYEHALALKINDLRFDADISADTSAIYGTVFAG